MHHTKVSADPLEIAVDLFPSNNCNFLRGNLRTAAGSFRWGEREREGGENVPLDKISAKLISLWKRSNHIIALFPGEKRRGRGASNGLESFRGNWCLAWRKFSGPSDDVQHLENGQRVGQLLRSALQMLRHLHRDEVKAHHGAPDAHKPRTLFTPSPFPFFPFWVPFPTLCPLWFTQGPESHGAVLLEYCNEVWGRS